MATPLLYHRDSVNISSALLRYNLCFCLSALKAFADWMSTHEHPHHIRFGHGVCLNIRQYTMSTPYSTAAEARISLRSSLFASCLARLTCFERAPWPAMLTCTPTPMSHSVPDKCQARGFSQLHCICSQSRPHSHYVQETTATKQMWHMPTRLSKKVGSTQAT